MFSCECGKFTKSYINDVLRDLNCPDCDTPLKDLNDYSIQTSLEAFKRLDDETISKRHLEVIKALEVLKTANNRMIAEHLSLPINSVTPRVKELRDMNPPKIIEDSIKEDHVTNRKTTYWSVN